MATGKVVFVSGNRGMLVVEHDEGFTLVEMLGDEGEIAVSDILKANWTATGGESMWGNGTQYDAYFQGCWGDSLPPIQMARQMGGG